MNMARSERRQAGRVLSAIGAAFSDSIDAEWFEAMTDTKEEAAVAQELSKAQHEPL